MVVGGLNPLMSPGGICCHCAPAETPQPWGRGAFPLVCHRSRWGPGECGLQHSFILLLALRSWLCARGELVKVLLQPKVSHLLSVGDICGSHAGEHPKGRSVSGACRGGQLSPVTETWVSSIRARPLLLDSPVFFSSLL